MNHNQSTYHALTDGYVTTQALTLLQSHLEVQSVGVRGEGPAGKQVELSPHWPGYFWVVNDLLKM